MTLKAKILDMIPKALQTLCFITATLFACGCTQSSPLIVYEPQFVKVPVPCAVDLPPKPKDTGDLDSAKRIAGYYKQVEMLLLDCQKVAETN